MRVLLFHQFLQCVDEFVDDGIIAFTQVACDTAADMVCDQIAVEGVDGGVDGGGLYQHVVAVCIAFYHAAYAADLSLDTVKSVYKPPTLVVAARGRFSTVFTTHSIPPFAIIIYPKGVFVKVYVVYKCGKRLSQNRKYICQSDDNCEIYPFHLTFSLRDVII